METGRRSSTSPQSFPAVKHLVWALVAGTALVISGMRDDTPPQPPATQAVAAPAFPAPVRSAPAPAAAPPARPAISQAYTDPVGATRAVPAYVSPAPVPPELAPRPPVRPAPLRPLPATPAPVTTAPVTPTPSPSPSAPAARPTVHPLPPSDPVRLRIPAAGVDAPVARLALDAAGALQPPPDDNPVLAGWYADGTAPGAVGTAITAGHVDTRVGPGVFHRLGSVRKGATIEVIRADLRTAVFTVYAVESYDKKNFPDKKVYGPSARPEIRVITCGGGFTKKSGYRSNVVVFAALTATR
ncbi:class F sortase [Streptomyces sp. NBC_00887]|uniref:class F sortase n=1 Tax=Streptomyces sp. NBC_00887 TaxID=2975859 RepID=UPI003867D9F7|nr:class F sortase [Streptomyces sp. NBC_00887]WSY35980.1 class F sortase [Streptomyces sp. NBC_00887]